MCRIASLLLAAGLASCASAFPSETKMVDVKLVVSDEPHLGLNFANESDRFILPDFEDENDAFAASREWQRGIDEGYFSRGLDLFCDCRGEYFSRDGRTWFKVAKARFYFERFSGWGH